MNADQRGFEQPGCPTRAAKPVWDRLRYSTPLAGLGREKQLLKAVSSFGFQVGAARKLQLLANKNSAPRQLPVVNSQLPVRRRANVKSLSLWEYFLKLFNQPFL